MADNAFRLLKRQLLKTILDSKDQDVDLRILIHRHKSTTSGLRRLKTLLLTKHKFNDAYDVDSGSSEHHREMCRAFCAVLMRVKDGLPLDSWCDFDDVRSEGLSLADCLDRYRGYIIHVAAALNRHLIVKALLDEVKQLGWGHPNQGKSNSALRRQLTAKDSQGHTAITVAALTGRRDVMDVLVSVSLEQMTRHHTRCIFRQALTQCTSLALTRPEIIKTDVRLMEILRNHSLSRHVSPYWLIAESNVQELREQVRQVGNNYLRVPGGPHLLHAAVWMYSLTTPLEPRQREVLLYLLEADPRSVNEVCSVPRPDVAGVCSSGTPAHFAVLRLAHSLKSSHQVHCELPLLLPEYKHPFVGTLRTDMGRPVPILATEHAERAVVTVGHKRTKARDVFEAGNISKTAEIPEAAEIPEGAEFLQAAEIPQAADTPHKGKIPHAGDFPEVGENVEVGEFPEIGEIPQVGENSKVQGIPKAGEHPQVAETPEVGENIEGGGKPVQEGSPWVILHSAKSAILNFLLLYGADFSKPNLEGKTAYDLLPPGANPDLERELWHYMNTGNHLM